jgi:predicted lipid-binding transport protein (Tim44 family)
MKFRRVLIVLSGLLPLLMFVAFAGARAGGGEGFHGDGGGGGGGGHGGGGGGGGGGGLIFDLLWLCLSHPIIGVPLLIIIAVVFYYYQQQSSNTAGMSPLTPMPLRRPGADPVVVIRTHDPNFDPNAFCNRVGAGFLKLQSAWCNQNLQEVRPFISDAVHERFSLQFAEQKAEGYHDRMDGVGIDQIIIADASSDEIYDELSVRIMAHAADYKVSMRDGRPIAGAAPMDGFVEIWSFLRRRGSATVPGKTGLLEGNCPNCGAPIEMNESANCKNCNALLRSGQYDWVLSEITQASEWQPGEHAAVPGLAALRARDPDLNVQSLEDRTSVIFWRKAAADRIGKLDPMFKVTSPAYGLAYSQRLKPPQGSPRLYFGDCAVGSVSVLGFIAAGNVDQALVEIRWSGSKFAVQADRTARSIDPPSTHHTLFVLMRKSSARTDLAKGISSAHCPNCGAPESGGTNGACEFCGTALNDGSNGWVLDGILGFADPEAQAMLQQLNVGREI